MDKKYLNMIEKYDNMTKCFYKNKNCNIAAYTKAFDKIHAEFVKNISKTKDIQKLIEIKRQKMYDDKDIRSFYECSIKECNSILKDYFKLAIKIKADEIKLNTNANKVITLNEIKNYKIALKKLELNKLDVKTLLNIFV